MTRRPGRADRGRVGGRGSAVLGVRRLDEADVGGAGDGLPVQSVNTQLLGLLLERVTGMSLAQWAETRLWNKVGAESDAFFYEAKRQPETCAFACYNATLRDYGRVGLLMLGRGSIGGRRVISESWVEQSTTADADYLQPRPAGPGSPPEFRLRLPMVDSARRGPSVHGDRNLRPGDLRQPSPPARHRANLSLADPGRPRPPQRRPVRHLRRDRRNRRRPLLAAERRVPSAERRDPDPPSETIGRYRITGTLGEGGMGTVYEAEQDQPQRMVALKVIRPDFVSPELIRRFARESEVLGRLQHPGIARSTRPALPRARADPGPFSRWSWSAANRSPTTRPPRSLDVTHRLELFTRVCDAVHYAHQQGVIHRDLKPANILVDATGQTQDPRLRRRPAHRRRRPGHPSDLGR